MDILRLGLPGEDDDLGLQVGGLNIGDQTPLEPGSQALLERRDVPGRAVAGHDDLLLGFVQSIERVKELLLGALFAGQELDVVDEEQIDVSVAFLEINRSLESDRVDQLVHERFGADVQSPEAREMPGDFMTDGMHQVGLPQTDPAVDVERVISARRLIRDGGCGGMGELIARAHDERVECVARMEPVARGDRRRPFGRVRQGGGAAWCGCGGDRSAGRGQLGSPVRRWRLSGGDGRRLAARKTQPEVAAIQFVCRLVDEVQIVLTDPVCEQEARDLDFQIPPVERKLLRRSEPGVEALGVDLALEAGEDSIPECHRSLSYTEKDLTVRPLRVPS